MSRTDRFGPCFSLAAAPPVARRREGGFAVAPEYGFALVTLGGRVRRESNRRRSTGRQRGFNLAILTPFFAAAMLTGCALGGGLHANWGQTSVGTANAIRSAGG